MIIFSKKIFILTLVSSIFFTSIFARVTPPDERPYLSIDEMNTYNTSLKKADLCPKNESENKYHHKLFLIDSTTPLSENQIKLIKRLLLGKDQLMRMHPYDRISIVRLREVSPQSNLPVMSMCRPRSGNSNSPYKLDKHDWLYETEKELQIQFQRLVNEIDSVLANINNDILPQNHPNRSGGSPIMEQLKEISRLPDYKFDDFSGYQKRTLTIVSDFHQNTKRIPFYDYCKKGKNNNCPSFEKFKEQKKIKLWIKKAIPNFGDNIEVKSLYLNTLSDPNLDREVLEFWIDYFSEAGIDNFEFEIESDQ